MAIVCHFLGANPSIKIRPKSLISRGNDDPPDCEAVAEDGRRIGFEVTILVEEELKEPHGRKWPSIFKEEGFLKNLQIRLKLKACKPEAIKGGPYSKLYLLFDVQQPFVSPTECEKYFQHSRWERPQPWDAAFLVFEPLVDIHAANMPHRTVKIPFLTSQE